MESLQVIVQPDGAFRLLAEGLTTPFRPGVEIEGRGRLGHDVGGVLTIEFEVGVQSSTRWRVGITSLVFVVLAAYNILVVEPPNRFAYVLFLLVPFIFVWAWVQVRVLTERAWPGLLSVARRLVEENTLHS